jgi:hypothetical protein
MPTDDSDCSDTAEDGTALGADDSRALAPLRWRRGRSMS